MLKKPSANRARPFEVKGGDTQLSGTVSIGMPVEFGHNVILPLIAQFCRKHPLVDLKIQFDFASKLNQELLRGTRLRVCRRLSDGSTGETEKVYDEIIDLCISENMLKKMGPPKHHRKYFESLEYVDYQESEPILQMWFHHHLEARHIDLNVRATVMDVQAIARLILAETGAGVLPGHLLAKLQKEGNASTNTKAAEDLSKTRSASHT